MDKLHLASQNLLFHVLHVLVCVQSINILWLSQTHFGHGKQDFFCIGPTFMELFTHQNLFMFITWFIQIHAQIPPYEHCLQWESCYLLYLIGFLVASFYLVAYAFLLSSGAMSAFGRICALYKCTALLLSLGWLKTSHAGDVLSLFQLMADENQMQLPL